MNKNRFNVKVSKKEELENQNAQAFNQFQFITDIHECQIALRTYHLRLDKLASDNKKLSSSIIPFKDSEYYKNYKKQYIRTSKPEEIEEKYKNTYKVNEIKVGDTSFWKYAKSEFEYYPIKLTLMGVAPAIIVEIIMFYFVHNVNVFTISIGIMIALFIYFIYFNTGLKNEREAYKREYDIAIEEIKDAKMYTEANENAYNHWKEEYSKYYHEQKEIIDERIKINNQEIQFLINEYKRIKETINRLYDLRINGRLCLHPNYRGFIPISIIFGYFDTGRCSQLEGHEGAYNLYEDEKMKGMIIEKLDLISKQINKLNGTMLYVGKTIEECNSRLAELEVGSQAVIRSLEKNSSNITNQLNEISSNAKTIETNTANAEYYAKIGARITAFNTTYNLLNS